jgi:5-hydroxyisourate hydrolase
VPGLSIHVVDVSRGVVAAGMLVAVDFMAGGSAPKRIAEGRISAKGTLDDPALAVTLETGIYRAIFQVADYYRAEGVALPAVPFLDAVRYDFGIADPRQHYHLPFKCTPWGYSCFRGGA